MANKFATIRNWSETQRKKNVTQAIKDVAKQLGNSPATSRKYYIYPASIDVYMDGSLFQTMEQVSKQEKADLPSELRSEEHAVLKLLEQHLVQESQKNS